jgi:hypothetical protein
VLETEDVLTLEALRDEFEREVLDWLLVLVELLLECFELLLFGVTALEPWPSKGQLPVRKFLKSWRRRRFCSRSQTLWEEANPLEPRCSSSQSL